ncbi:MAG TPA: lysophospholipid acyltransferase family protein [Anaerolineae bacterium]|nr:lysophospholipid acyltransferase family protein [Anaerolineae bacterium]
MRFLKGTIRVIGLILGVILGGTLVIVLSWLPFWRYRQLPLAAWIPTWTARFYCWLFNVEIVGANKEKIGAHQGLLFANHVTYFDIFVLSTFIPLRYLAKEEVLNIPFVGRVGRIIGCVFVKREDKSSRRQARQVIGKLETYPAITIYPEGRRGTGEGLLPFRYGAFAIALEHGIPILPCVIKYEQFEYMIWQRSEGILRAIWRLGSRPGGRLRARLVLLPVVVPREGDTAEGLAKAVQAEMEAILD